jgi:transcriptional/translational regulatory protein YebC/TACO1
VGPREGPKLLRLLDALDEHDDVDQVHANFDIGAEVLEEAAAA